jgi:hypothetical protein
MLEFLCINISIFIENKEIKNTLFFCINQRINFSQYNQIVC